MNEPGDAPARSILVVDDDEVFRAVLARALRSRGYDACVADGYDQAIERVRAQQPGFAVVDLRMPGRSGLEIIETIKRLCPGTVVLALTADRSPESVAEARRRGASLYLNKPTDADEIVSALQAAVPA